MKILHIQEVNHAGDNTIYESMLDAINQGESHLLALCSKMGYSVSLSDHLLVIGDFNDGFYMIAAIERKIKKFIVQNGIGSSKYTVSKHDGESLHKDGSKFWDIAIFKSKKKMNAYISSLLDSGYTQS